jgi:hypothetical protein
MQIKISSDTRKRRCYLQKMWMQKSLLEKKQTFNLFFAYLGRIFKIFTVKVTLSIFSTV